MELNKVLLVGNLVADPIYRNTSTGRAVADVRLAVSRRSGIDRESGEVQKETVFVDVTMWEKSADFARNYMHKGSRVLVEGRLKQDQWQDKESGQNRSKLSVVAERVQFAESRAEAEARGAGGGGYDDESGGGGGGGGRAYSSPPRQAAPRNEAAPRARESAPSRDFDAGPGFTQDPAMGGGGNTEDDLPF
jgi:single-strand DNA-binding protein